MLVFVPIMLALCSMRAAADYAQINARLIGAALFMSLLLVYSEWKVFVSDDKLAIEDIVSCEDDHERHPNDVLDSVLNLPSASGEQHSLAKKWKSKSGHLE